MTSIQVKGKRGGNLRGEDNTKGSGSTDLAWGLEMLCSTGRSI